MRHTLPVFDNARNDVVSMDFKYIDILGVMNICNAAVSLHDRCFLQGTSVLLMQYSETWKNAKWQNEGRKGMV